MKTQYRFKISSHLKPIYQLPLIGFMALLAIGMFIEQNFLLFTRKTEYFIQDWLMEQRNKKHPAASEHIVFIRVNEETLRRNDGESPSRESVGRLVRALYQSKAKTIIFDSTFDMNRKGTDKLIQFTQGIDPLIYPVAFVPERRDAPSPRFDKLTPFQVREQNHAPDQNYALHRVPHPVLAKHVKHLGHFMFSLSPVRYDRTVRDIPLLIKIDGQYYPALSLIAVCLFNEVPLDGSGVTVKWGKHLILDNHKGWRQEIPIDKEGRMRINYIGGIERFEQGYSFWSLDSELKEEEFEQTGKLPDRWKEDFAGKLVIIGGDARNLDLIPTPFSKDFPGFAVHATAIDNILRGRGDFVRETSPWLTMSLTLCFIVGMVALQLWLFHPELRKRQHSDWVRAVGGFIVFASFALVYVIFAFTLFYIWGQFLNFSLPMMGMLVAWIFVSQRSYIEQLRQEYIYRETIIKNIDNGLIILDSLTGKIEMNPKAATLIGFKTSKTTLEEIEKHSVELANHFRQVMTTKKFNELRLTIEGRNFQANVVPLNNEKQGNYFHLIAVLTDVTEVQRLSAEVQRQRDTQKHHQILDNLVIKLNHDIKNDLSGIIALTPLLRGAHLSSEEASDITSRIIEASHRIAEVVNRVSHAIRTMDTEKLTPLPSRYQQDIRSLVGSVIEEIQPRARATNININLESSESLPPIECYTDSLREAIRNIVINALEAMPNGGQLTIQIECFQEEMRLRIRDTGHGIPSEIQDRIFEPFFTCKTWGNGMGLVQARESIEEIHRGKIFVESEVGRGTEFTLILPV